MSSKSYRGGDELIELKAMIGGKEVEFTFERMSVERASSWASRMKSRVTYYESMQKEREMFESKPILDQDPDVFEKLSDNEAIMLSKIMSLSKELSAHCKFPPPEKLQEYVDSNLEDVLTVLTDYLGALFPTEEESKNLSGDSKQVVKPSSGSPVESVKTAL
jgi:hypothetical protein